MSLGRFASLACLLVAGVVHAQDESQPRLREAIPGIDLPSEYDTTSKVYIVQLRTPSAVEHHDNLAKASAKLGVAAPAAFSKNSAEVRSYTQVLAAEQDRALARVGSSAQKVYSYLYSMNGFAARMTEVQAAKMKHLPEVLHVWEDELRPLTTDDSAKFLGLFKDEVGLRGAPGLDGEDVIIGVIDSGIVPDHPSLDDSRQSGPSICRSSWADATFLGQWLCRVHKNAERDLLFEPVDDWNGICQEGDGFTAEDCNNKLLGARYFVDGAVATGPIDAGELFSPRDVDGHGTHTATTAAGNKTDASAFGTFLGTIEGIAPRARIAVYKACWLRPGTTRALCNTSDLALAIDTAVADGVDIINYSVGDTRRFVTAPDDIALMAAAKAGVFSATSAGNEGPELGTIGSPGGSPWVMTIGASSRDGQHAVEALRVESPTSVAGLYEVKEASFTPPLRDVSPLEGRLVLVDDGDESEVRGESGTTRDGCQALENTAEISGNIALIERGGCFFTTMIANAEAAGAVAVVVYNIAGAPIVMTPMDDTAIDIPAVMIGQADGNLIADEIDGGETVDIVLDKSLFLSVDDTGNVMGSFSSRGPGPILDILKPDVTAPGIDILAGFTPDAINTNAGELFAHLTGTSMSAPHVSGVAALLKQAHPEWTPSMLKSALMTTAYQEVDQHGGETRANPFDFGAGHINPNDAVDPGLVYDTTNDEYDAVACGIDSPAIDEARCTELREAGFSSNATDMNQASIAVSALINEQTITRRVVNVSDTTDTYVAEIDAPPEMTMTVAPDSLTLAPGQSATFDVTLRTDGGNLNLWRFGSLTWAGGDRSVRMPVAVRPASLIAPAEAIGRGTEGSETFEVTFGYSGTYTPRVHGLRRAATDPTLMDRVVAQDPDMLFEPVVGPGVDKLVQENVPEGVLYLRYALFDIFTSGNDDLDMYVYYCPEGGTTCSEIGNSGGPTSEEEFNILFPGPGDYQIYVHGFDTEGPNTTYDLFVWQLNLDDVVGNMSVTAPNLVSAGSIVDIGVEWAGLIANEIYLGAISHTTPAGLVAVTIINIGTF